MHYQLVRKSSNKKVGAIPVSNSHRGTCPPSCPLSGDGGCYAEAGYYTRMNWDKLDSGERGSSWERFVHSVSKLPAGQLWRHNVSGDLPGSADKLDASALKALVSANTGKRGFTYTHYPLTPHNTKAIRAANRDGFTVNVSTNSLQELDKVPTNLPAVTLVSASEYGEDWRTVDKGGRRVVRCPAEYRDDVSCATCKLCSVSNRAVVVGFTPHGTKSKQADIIATAA